MDDRTFGEERERERMLWKRQQPAEEPIAPNSNLTYIYYIAQISHHINFTKFDKSNKSLKSHILL